MGKSPTEPAGDFAQPGEDVQFCGTGSRCTSSKDEAEAWAVMRRPMATASSAGCGAPWPC